MGNAGDYELLRDFVGEVIVRSENNRAVVVVTFEQVIECLEFFLCCSGNAFGALLGDECPPSLWIVGRSFEELLVALLFPEVELVAIDVVAIGLVLIRSSLADRGIQRRRARIVSY
ncbi:hypothetical protein C495_16850 [Natronorubrum sulfidifaciens JCM 14089]|uniref:Uncharacterized protein n=1 Tax=Natronorubrum sulfidifaciens JCM 14089 TaxID=1230460 RepID=L9VVH9_9EURY|nr:hypothetical protein C495_16850 [Natronorubrum sulfidifaciens JCM 14089]